MKKQMKKNKIKIFTGILVLALLSMGTACGGNKTGEEPEETGQEPEETSQDIEEPEAAAREPENEEPEEPEKVQAVTELSPAAQHQISAFIAANIRDYRMDGSLKSYEDMKQQGPSIEVLVDYIRFQKQGGPFYDESTDTTYGLPVSDTAADGLPFQWGTYLEDTAWDTEPFTGVYQVSREEFQRFYESGWGIDVPEDMEYKVGESLEDGTFYGAELGESGLGISWDTPMMGIAGGEVEIIGYEDGVYSLSGYCYYGAVDEAWEEESFRHDFTAEAVESGDKEIFDGLQIIGFWGA